MTTVSRKDMAADTDFAIDSHADAAFGDAVRSYLRRVRGGDMGSLPAVLGLIVLFVVFGLANDRFMSALNLANLVTQAGSICVLAMGLVFVLLLGDIDLSAGVAGGVAACAMALTIVDAGWPWWLAMAAGIGAGALIGVLIGVLRAKLGIPSFVVTLAFFLGLQGVTLKLIGEGGSVRVDDPVIRGITINNLSVTAGWIIAAGGRRRVRCTRGLPVPQQDDARAGARSVRRRGGPGTRGGRGDPRGHLCAQRQSQRQSQRGDPRHSLCAADDPGAADRADPGAQPHGIRQAHLCRRR